MKKDKVTPIKSICCPGPEGWQLWALNAGESSTLVAEADAEHCSDLQAKGELSLYGFPARAAFAVPVWVHSKDEDIVESAVQMHLEMQGLAPANPDAKLVSTSPIVQEEGRRLVLATVLTGENEYDLPDADATRFEISPRLYDLPDNHLIVWKELGRLSVAVTRDACLCYFQVLTSWELDESAVLEIRCILLNLQGQEAIGELSGVMLWLDDCPPEKKELLEKELGLPLRFERRPNPMPPASDSKLVPEEVLLARFKRERRKKILSIVSVAGMFYLLLLGVALGWSYLEDRKLANLKTAIDVQTQAVNKAIEARDVFAPLEVTNEESNALERMLDLSSAVASSEKRSLRFQELTASMDSIFIKGEAKHQSMALLFVKQARKILEPKGFTLEYKPETTRSRSTGTLKFTINGTLQEGIAPTGGSIE